MVVVRLLVEASQMKTSFPDTMAKWLLTIPISVVLIKSLVVCVSVTFPLSRFTSRKLLSSTTRTLCWSCVKTISLTSPISILKVLTKVVCSRSSTLSSPLLSRKAASFLSGDTVMPSCRAWRASSSYSSRVGSTTWPWRLHAESSNRKNMEQVSCFIKGR